MCGIFQSVSSFTSDIGWLVNCNPMQCKGLTSCDLGFAVGGFFSSHPYEGQNFVNADEFVEMPIQLQNIDEEPTQP